MSSVSSAKYEALRKKSPKELRQLLATNESEGTKQAIHLILAESASLHARIVAWIALVVSIVALGFDVCRWILSR